MKYEYKIMKASDDAYLLVEHRTIEQWKIISVYPIHELAEAAKQRMEKM
jgi:hypothetical protein